MDNADTPDFAVDEKHFVDAKTGAVAVIPFMSTGMRRLPALLHHLFLRVFGVNKLAVAA